MSKSRRVEGRGHRPASAETPKQRNQKVGQGRLQSRAREIHECLRTQQHEGRRQERPPAAARNPNDSECSETEQIRYRQTRKVELACEKAGKHDHKEPQRVRIGLNTLHDVPAKSVALKEIVDRAEADVGVIAHPRIDRVEVREENEHPAEQRSGSIPRPSWYGSDSVGLPLRLTHVVTRASERR